MFPFLVYFFYNSLQLSGSTGDRDPLIGNRSTQVGLCDEHATWVGPARLSLSEEINGDAWQQCRATSPGSSNRISPAAVGQESDGDGGISASAQG